MKRVILFFLTAVLILGCLSFTGCEESEDVIIENFLDERYEEILGMLNDAETPGDVKNYLLKWAQQEGIKASYDKYDNVIMSSSATEGYRDMPGNTLQCSISLKQPEQSALSISVASYLISQVENHGFLRVIFTENNEGKHIGASKISSAYLSGTNLISLDWGGNNSLLLGSAGTKYYKMSHELEWVRPSYTHAFEISISGLSGTAFTETGKHPNPITIIGDLLAAAKSNSILLEIATFNGGTSADTYPSSVSCTILVNQNDINKITRRVTNIQNKFQDNYGGSQPDYSFTFTETALPEKVISYEDTANLISFLYTCIDGNYLKDDAGELIAKSNIGSISTGSGNLEIEICSSSKTTATLDEMESVFDTICGLCNISYKSTSGTMVWEKNIISDNEDYSEADTLIIESSEIENPLISQLDAAIKGRTDKEASHVRSLENTACAIIAARKPSLNIVGFGLTRDNLMIQTEILMDYISALPSES